MTLNEKTHNLIDKATSDPFLGVRSSLTGQAWVDRPHIPRIAEAIAEKLGVEPVVGKLIAARGISYDECDQFFNPSLRDSLPDPSLFMDMDKASDRLVSALNAGEKIAVFGDYDVDGATSSSLLYRYFQLIGQKLDIYIPDRNIEGYGPNINALMELQKRGASLVITVDCGTMSFEPLEAAFNAGLDVLVVDHHKAETVLPKSVAVVNPNRLDESGEYGQLAAVGVAFMVCVALNRSLREAGWFAKKGIKEPNLLSLLDLVALGTVCDVVPLTGVNRAFVAQGLKVMRDRRNLGLAALADVGRVQEAPSTYHAGFVMGPRVNAGGRVGESSLGARLLTTENWDEALQLAERLDAYNKDRQAIEAAVQEDAQAQLSQRYGIDGEPETCVFVCGNGWHAGVIGIVASRLKEKYKKPTFVLALEKGEAKASGRSIPGVDMGAAVLEAVHKGLLIKGGGHAMAAGFSVVEDKIEALHQFFNDYLKTAVAKAGENRALKVDGAIALSGATVELLDQIAKVGPFGQGNSSPRFAIADVALVKADIVGQNHLRCIFKGKDGSSMKVMAFRSVGEPLGDSLLQHVGQRFHIAGKLKKDDWGAVPKVEMTLDDAAKVAL